MIDYKEQKIKTIKEDKFEGEFLISPLNNGFGFTVGNALRRVLLSSIRGSAVTSVKIDGILHEYTTIEGIQEDILNILLNLKELRIYSRSDEPQILKIHESGEKEVKAIDLDITDAIEIFDPDQTILTLTDKKSKIDMEITVESGYGYKLVDNDKRNYIGVIPLDSDFSPVSLVNFEVKNTRVGKETDLDEILLTIKTKSVSPSFALKKALEALDEEFKELNNAFDFSQPVIKAKVKGTPKTIKKVSVKSTKKTIKKVSKSTLKDKDKKDETPKKSKKIK